MPRWLSGSHYIDVTAQYQPVSDVEVAIKGAREGEQVLLSRTSRQRRMWAVGSAVLVVTALVLVVPGSKVHLPGQLLITLQVQEEGTALAIRVRLVRVGQVLQIQEMVVHHLPRVGLAL